MSALLMRPRLAYAVMWLGHLGFNLELKPLSHRDPANAYSQQDRVASYASIVLFLLAFVCFCDSGFQDNREGEASFTLDTSVPPFQDLFRHTRIVLHVLRFEHLSPRQLKIGKTITESPALIHFRFLDRTQRSGILPQMCELSWRNMAFQSQIFSSRQGQGRDCFQYNRAGEVSVTFPTSPTFPTQRRCVLPLLGQGLPLRLQKP